MRLRLLAVGLVGLTLAGCSGNPNEPVGSGPIGSSGNQPAGAPPGVGIPTENAGAVPSPSPANPTAEPADVPTPYGDSGGG